MPVTCKLHQHCQLHHSKRPITPGLLYSESWHWQLKPKAKTRFLLNFCKINLFVKAMQRVGEKGGHTSLKVSCSGHVWHSGPASGSDTGWSDCLQLLLKHHGQDDQVIFIFHCTYDQKKSSWSLMYFTPGTSRRETKWITILPTWEYWCRWRIKSSIKNIFRNY